MTIIEFYRGTDIGRLAILESRKTDGTGTFLFPDAQYRDRPLRDVRPHYMPQYWVEREAEIQRELQRCRTLYRYYSSRLARLDNDPHFLFYFRNGPKRLAEPYRKKIDAAEAEQLKYQQMMEDCLHDLHYHRQEIVLVQLMEARREKALADFHDRPFVPRPVGTQQKLFE